MNADKNHIDIKVRALDGTTGEPITFTELKTLAVRCGPTQHDYWQGQDAPDHEQDELRKLLYCKNCGDVLRFSLPVEDSIE